MVAEHMHGGAAEIGPLIPGVTAVKPNLGAGQDGLLLAVSGAGIRDR